MNIYSNEKISVPEERYNELIRAEFALRIVRQNMLKKLHEDAPIGEMAYIIFSRSEIETLLLMTGKGDDEA